MGSFWRLVEEIRIVDCFFISRLRPPRNFCRFWRSIEQYAGSSPDHPLTISQEFMQHISMDQVPSIPPRKYLSKISAAH